MNTEFSAIEVPGEANPLTEGILYHVLRSASSTDPNQIQTGTKQLQVWEKSSGFYPLLQVCDDFLGYLHSADLLPVCLPRQVSPDRSPLPRHHSTQERHRQILAEDCGQVGPSLRQRRMADHMAVP